jgi:hypothetical protein
LGGVTTSVTDFNFRAEITEDDVTVLFVGSELLTRRGANMTGKSLYVHEPLRRIPGLKNMRTVTRRPCGFLIETDYQSTAHRKLVVQMLILPLEPPPNRRPQIVGYSAELSKRDPNETIASPATIKRLFWIDIGAGIPDYPPN